jgi:arylsulfatase A-like enzyme
MRTTHILRDLVVAALVLGCVDGMHAAADAPRPNIIIIMADDMGFSDIGCYGSEIETPTLDRLAAGGLRFTQFYNTGRCCPTRAALLTGLYSHQTGVGLMMSPRGYDSYDGDLNRRCLTIAEILGTAGYATYMSGKWHVTKQVGHWSGNEQLTSKHNWPRQRGFDRFYGTIHGAANFFNPVSLVRDNQPLDCPRGDYYYTDAISDNAAGFIRDHAALEEVARKPFFLYVAYTAPHWPMHARPRDIAKYKGRYDAGWDALRKERHERMIRMGIVKPEWKLSPRNPEVPAWEDAGHKPWHRAVMEVYAAMVDSMDQGISRIVTALEETGQLDNTLVLFLADNGGCAEGGRNFERSHRSGGTSLHSTVKTRDGRWVEHGNYDHVLPGPEETYQEYGRPWANASNTPFRFFKHWNHEGGIAAPLVAHWPRGIDARGAFRHQPSHLIDLMATCVDLSGAAYPQERDGWAVHPLEGKSLVPAFHGKPIERDALYWQHLRNRAVRVGKWKLAASGDDGPWELYDLEADRTETEDLAAKHPAKAEELKAKWNAWAARVGVVRHDRLRAEQDARRAAERERRRPALVERPPNIVFILADDLGWSELGCYGNTFNETPQLDGLASAGMRFTQAYASAPVCSPYRASLLTGLSPARHGILDFLRPDGDRHLDPYYETLPEALKERGYATGYIGKWHLSGYKSRGAPRELRPTDHGFDEELLAETGGVQSRAIFHPYATDQGVRWLGDLEKRLPGNEYLLDRMSLEATDFIERHKDGPFFLQVSHYAVHCVLKGKDAVVEKYRKKHPPGKSLPNLRGHEREDPDNQWASDHNPHLAAMLESIDDGVGQILGKLDELGLAENTIVVFTSDNGGNLLVTSNAPLRSGKSSLYEGGIRVPLIVRWPSVVRAGSVCRTPTCNTDFYPTFLATAGLELPRRTRYDGVSILSLLKDPAARIEPRTLAWHYPLDKPHFLGGRSSGAIRRGDWKLIEFFDTGQTELYDLAGDVSETRDVKDAHPEIAQDLLERLVAWRNAAVAMVPEGRR